MPMPVSVTVKTTCRSSWLRVRRDSVPPLGMASMAFRIRLVTTSFSSAGRPITTGTDPRSSPSWSGTPALSFFSSQRGRVMASPSRITWSRSSPTKASSGRRRANFWMRRTVSAPPVAAFSMTSSPRRTTSTLLGFFPMSCA